MTVAVIVLASAVTVLACALYLAVRVGVVEWSSSDSCVSHHFRGPRGGCGVDVENIPCAYYELVFGRYCIDIAIGRWTL